MGASGGVGDGAELSPLPEGPCASLRRTSRATVRWPTCWTVRWTGLSCSALRHACPKVQHWECLCTPLARGLPPLVKGQPLRTRTDAHGAYFLPVPPHTPGFVSCAARAHLALATFVRGRQVGETLTDQQVSPPSEFFAALLQPLFPAQEVSTIEGELSCGYWESPRTFTRCSTAETTQTASGLTIADTDGDGVVCAFVGGTQGGRPL